MPVIIEFEKSTAYEPIKLTSRPIILGRSSKCHVQIKDEMCSGQHAQLELATDGSVILTDLNSTNGTYINEAMVSTASRVYIGDVMRIGNTTFKIDKNALSEREAIPLRSTANKTSFTKLSLPPDPAQQLSEAAKARKRAMGRQTSSDIAIEPEAQEISVVFDQNEIEDNLQDASKSINHAAQKIAKAKKVNSAPGDNLSMSGVDAVFDLENSSGSTKMIKLDKAGTSGVVKKAMAKKRSQPPPKNKEPSVDDSDSGIFGKFKKIFKKD